MQNSHFRGGIKFLRFPSQTSERGLDAFTPEEDAQLGPLKELTGKWVGAPNDGWNIISIPAKGGFRFEVTPFSETLTFNPNIFVDAGNVGPVLNGEENNQQLYGLMYEQVVNSSCTPIVPKPEPTTLPNGAVIPANFERVCKFEDGATIHAETGFFLNITNFTSNLNIARLSTIPHGNSVLQLGQSHESSGDINNNFIDAASVLPTGLDGNKLSSSVGYGLDQILEPRFPDFPGFSQLDPNSALRSMLKGKKILEMTTLVLSTEFDKAGILNIPFLQHNVEATKMTAIFWIQKIQGEGEGGDKKPDFWQLQYTQTIDLVFPIPGNPTPIIWPHVTVNTLRKEVL